MVGGNEGSSCCSDFSAQRNWRVQSAHLLFIRSVARSHWGNKYFRQTDTQLAKGLDGFWLSFFYLPTPSTLHKLTPVIGPQREWAWLSLIYFTQSHHKGTVGLLFPPIRHIHPWPLVLSPSPHCPDLTPPVTTHTQPVGPKRTQAQRRYQIKRSWLAINGALLYLHHGRVCACIQAGVVNHAECAPALPPPSCPQCSHRGAATYGYWHGGDGSVSHCHTDTEAQHRITGQPPSEHGEKLKTVSSHHWWIYTQPLIDWRDQHPPPPDT